VTARNRYLLLPALAAALGFAQMAGCGSASNDDGTSAAELAAQKAKKNHDALKACHLLDDGQVAPDDEPHACDPASTKKTTICHVPPGNPANAHTLCIGNPAVGPHVHHHGDYLGPCKVEATCPPPGGGAGGDDGNGGNGHGKGGAGDDGEGGAPGASGEGGVTGAGGTPVPPPMDPPPPSNAPCEGARVSCGPGGMVPIDGCATSEVCAMGCCWRSVQ